jgi:hypothetical protein
LLNPQRIYRKIPARIASETRIPTSRQKQRFSEAGTVTGEFGESAAISVEWRGRDQWRSGQQVGCAPEDSSDAQDA